VVRDRICPQKVVFSAFAVAFLERSRIVRKTVALDRHGLVIEVPRLGAALSLGFTIANTFILTAHIGSRAV
jgi:hypothetical protein